MVNDDVDAADHDDADDCYDGDSHDLNVIMWEVMMKMMITMSMSGYGDNDSGWDDDVGHNVGNYDIYVRKL